MANMRFRKGHGKSSQISPVTRLTEVGRGLLVRMWAYKWTSPSQCPLSHPQEGISISLYFTFLTDKTLKPLACDTIFISVPQVETKYNVCASCLCNHLLCLHKEETDRNHDEEEIE